MHQGHAKVIRDRSFDLPIEQAPTLGTVMQSAGYRTALIGKWGIGGGTEHAGTPQESTAYPTKRGFDYYFGYLDHVSGHHHYPKEDPNPISPTKRSGIWDGDKCVTADCDKAYSVDLLTARAKKWIIDTHRQNPRQPCRRKVVVQHEYVVIEREQHCQPRKQRVCDNQIEVFVL